MAEVVWPQSLVDLLLEMPDKDRDQIFQRIARLERFPKMYPVRTSGRFRGHRCFIAGEWIVYYRVMSGVVYVRAIWPLKLP